MIGKMLPVSGFILGLTLIHSSACAEGRLAVCNLSQLYQECSLSKDKRAELEALRSKAEKELQSYKKKIEDLLKKLPLYEKGSPEYKEIEKQIEELKTEAGAKKRVETANLERKFTEFLKQFHDVASDAIKDHAKGNNVDFVFQIQNDDLGRFNKAEPLLQKIFTQQVLYSVDSVDITTKVLKKLDADYEAKK